MIMRLDSVKQDKVWYQKPEIVMRLAALVGLVCLIGGLHYFAGDFCQRTMKLVVSGNVEGLVEYLRSFGPWAMVVSFVLDVLINAGSVFPSVFLSTANGLIFGLPLGILISWLAETVGVVLSFLLMRFFFRDTAELLIAKSNSLQHIDRASGEKGLYWMAVARMLPYVPSGILTAVGAVSRISVKDYIIANLIGKLPSTSLEVVIGHDLVNFQENSMRLGILVSLGLLAFLLYKRYVLTKK